MISYSKTFPRVGNRQIGWYALAVNLSRQCYLGMIFTLATFQQSGKVLNSKHLLKILSNNVGQLICAFLMMLAEIPSSPGAFLSFSIFIIRSTSSEQNGGSSSVLESLPDS